MNGSNENDRVHQHLEIFSKKQQHHGQLNCSSNPIKSQDRFPPDYYPVARRTLVINRPLLSALMADFSFVLRYDWHFLGR